jgi:tetratricopeptide (TPR) repeat protein
LTASLFALLIAALMSYPFSVLPFLVVSAFLLAEIHFRDTKNLKSRHPESREWIWTLCGLLLVAGCLCQRYPTFNVMGKNHQSLKRYAEAEECFLMAANIVPGRLYPWYLLTRLYEEMGLHEKACETAAIVLTKEPKVQSTAIREMRDEAKRLCETAGE